MVLSPPLPMRYCEWLIVHSLLVDQAESALCNAIERKKKMEKIEKKKKELRPIYGQWEWKKPFAFHVCAAHGMRRSSIDERMWREQYVPPRQV